MNAQINKLINDNFLKNSYIYIFIQKISMFQIEFIMYTVNDQDFIRLTTITWKENHMKKISLFSIHITVYILGS